MRVNAGPTAANIEIGEEIGGRYWVEAPLGHGATGDVFTACDRVLERRVAIKVLRAGCHQAVTDRLLRGARAVATVEHPHLVRLYDYGIDPVRGVYLVMERPLGDPLSTLLRQQPRFPLALSLEVARQLSAGLGALHAHHVVHRDIKPGNVLVDLTAPHPTAKLLDFGLARALQSIDGMTQANALLGTWSYLPPERVQRRTAAPSLTAGDVYSLGCVLYEMLAGAPPFVAATRTALLAAIATDDVPSLAQRDVQVPSAVVALVTQCLAKDPERRPRASDVEQALRSMLMNVPASTTPQLSSSLAGGRIRLEARIGSGAHGEVFRAQDHRDGRQVAVKRVRSLGPHQVDRLKREFRQLYDLHHAHLARCEELWVEGDDAYVVMELIDGVGLDAHAALDDHGIITVFRDVADGLAALHAVGLVHRDVKPAHVLVGGGQRAKLIDFSISASVGSPADACGTPRYRAPEAAQTEVAPALDVYAFGVVLREVLDASRAVTVPVHQRLLALSQRCQDIDPQARPSASEILVAFGATQPKTDVVAARFVGRDVERARLRRACAPGAGLHVVAIVGASGVGKTALVDALRVEIVGDALVCSSVCRSAESVAFGAIDGALDALCDYLERDPALLGGETLPHARALLRWFPAFGRVALVRASAAATAQLRDTAEAFSRAHEALRIVLLRLCKKRRVVLVLDDLHWIDQRTASLLTHVLRSPEPPALTVICTRRPAEELPAPELDILLRALAAEEFALGPLSPPECQRLLSTLGIAVSNAQVWWERTQGHPLFLLTLATRASADQALPPTLHAALQAQLSQLEPASRHALALLSVAAASLPIEMVCRLTAVDEDQLRHLGALHLVRRIVSGTAARVETYHAIVRDAVVATLDESDRRGLHRALATELSTPPLLGEQGPALVDHMAHAGAVSAAVRLAEQLATEAERRQQELLASDLYAVAARHSEGTESTRYLVQQAEALHRAGQSHAAAGCLALASNVASGDQARALRRRAGDLALLSGDAHGGLALLREATDDARIVLASTFDEMLVQTMVALGGLRDRGLQWQARDADALDPEAASSLDLILSLAQGLSHVDLRALPLSFRALHLALDLGDPSRLLRASAVFVWNTASHFPTELVAPTLALCESLTLTQATPYARALLQLARAEHLHFDAHFLAAELAWESAEQLLTTHCSGVARELAGVRGGLATIQYAHKGDFRTWLPETLRWQADAELRQDIYHLNMLRSAHALVWIAQDDPARTRRELELAERSWPGTVSIFEISVVLFLDVADRYEGLPDAALRPAQGRASVLDSPAAQTPFVRGYLLLHQGWGALRAIARDHGAAVGMGADTSEVTGLIDSLQSLDLPMWRHIADALEANRLWLCGDMDGALQHLRQSELGFRSLSMQCFAACARRRRGELLGGSIGTRLVRESDQQLGDLGVVKPERWSRAYFSMFDASQQHAATLQEA